MFIKYLSSYCFYPRSFSAPAGLDMEEDFILVHQNFKAVFHEVSELCLYVCVCVRAWMTYK